MKQILIVGIIGLVALFGGAAYLAATGTAIIYCLGGSSKHKARRVFFGILGIGMLYGFICAIAYIVKNGWPL